MAEAERSLGSSSQSAPLTHLHEELSLLHHGLASFAALLDHPEAQEITSVTSCLTDCVITTTLLEEH